MIDRYSKAVFTVIAIALVTIAIQNAVGGSKAQSPDIQKVQICDSMGCAILLPFGSRSWGLGVVPRLNDR